MGRVATLVALLSTACVSSSSNVCPDNSLCPGGFVCDEDVALGGYRCLLPEQIAACAEQGKLEGDACEVAGAPGACRDGACIGFFCGDGYVSEGEACEGADLRETDCYAFGFYGGEGLGCTSSCTFDIEGCKVHDYCGDLEVNGAELCDGPETRTCVSIGFDAGTTSCNLQCGFSIGDCSRFGWNPESLSDVVALAVAGSARDDQWAFGLEGRAMRFEGAYWNTVITGVQNTLINGWSNGHDDAWAVGQSNASPSRPSVVIHWDGTQWSTVTGLPSGEYIDVWGTSPTNMYVATSSSILAYDGTSWTTVPGFTGQPFSMRGSASNDIWVATRTGPLMHYDGSTWTNRAPAGVTIQFLDANSPADVWAVGHLTANQGTGVIARWNGSAWQQWVTAQEHYNAIASTAPNDTWVAGVDGIMRHWDGVAWSSSTNIGSSPSGLTALSGLVAVGVDEVVGVSTLNLAYRYRGQAFGVFRPLGTNPFDAPDQTAVWGLSANAMFVSNVKGEVWRFDGVTWSLSYTVPGPQTPVSDIWGSSNDDVWAVAENGNAYHFNGTTWTSDNVATDLVLDRVWGSSGDVWAFGAGGAWHRIATNNWQFHALGAGNVVSVSGSGASDVWAVLVNGSTSKLFHYDGTGWEEVPTAASFPVLAVVALSPTNVHVTAQEGRFLHFDGAMWTESVLPVLADLTHIAATAPDDVIAAGERDLAHFNGTAWSTVRTPVDYVPNTADYLPIVDLQVVPGRVDMLQKKFRIRTLIRTRPLICRQQETCGDAVDNDCDDQIDDLDDDCP